MADILPDGTVVLDPEEVEPASAPPESLIGCVFEASRKCKGKPFIEFQECRRKELMECRKKFRK